MTAHSSLLSSQPSHGSSMVCFIVSACSDHASWVDNVIPVCFGSVRQKCLDEQKRRRLRATKKISTFIGTFVVCFSPYVITRWAEINDNMYEFILCMWEALNTIWSVIETWRFPAFSWLLITRLEGNIQHRGQKKHWTVAEFCTFCLCSAILKKLANYLPHSAWEVEQISQDPVCLTEVPCSCKCGYTRLIGWKQMVIIIFNTLLLSGNILSGFNCLLFIKSYLIGSIGFNPCPWASITGGMRVRATEEERDNKWVCDRITGSH